MCGHQEVAGFVLVQLTSLNHKYEERCRAQEQELKQASSQQRGVTERNATQRNES